MQRRSSTWVSLVLTLALAASTAAATTAQADIAPPWCGTPEPDAAANLPDGSLPTHPVGSFPHIPYYAIRCTLDAIAAASNGRMRVEVIGQSATGRDMYLVTINALETLQQQEDFARWQQIRHFALRRPAQAQHLLQQNGDAVKIPIFIQAGIHGGETEGVDASMQIIERLATTPYGTDPEVDNVLDHAIMLFNVVQNPDGRVAGTRANGNGFDLNRDYLTQSQTETRASVSVIHEWLPAEGLDLHGYATPTLVEATTKPHNPGVEYDMYIKWNQPRLDTNEAALDAIGQQMQRPVNDWCADADLPPGGLGGTCADGSTPGPAVAEGWDDWGPFYTSGYMQLHGLDESTVEMCQSINAGCGGRAGARLIQYTVSWSTMQFAVAHRHDMLYDQMEVYRRGVAGEVRPDCCPAPFDVDNNWMTEYPRAYVIPFGQGQRSDAEANRLVAWLLFNGIEVTRLLGDYPVGNTTFQRGSYVVWMNQALRGLADTALSLGIDVTPRIFTLYAPPASWSHGYLWGADVVTIPGEEVSFAPSTRAVREPNRLSGGVRPGAADAYALEVDSATAVRALNALLGAGVAAELAMEPFNAATGGSLPAGSVLFQADSATATALAASGQANGLWFHPVRNPLPDRDPVVGTPRIAVLTGAVNQDVWSLRNLGFTAGPVPTGTTSVLNNPGQPDPLLNYDVVFNTATWPSGPTARARLTAFFARGGGYIGAGANGANFLSATSSGQLPGLVPASQTGGGQSGIFYWANAGGTGSPIVGTYPSQDTAIMDPPTWFSSVPATATVDGQLLADTTSTFASGLWRFPRLTSAATAPIIVHAIGTAPGSAARLTAFAMNPLYRADPEREWPMVSLAAYWADQIDEALVAVGAAEAAGSAGPEFGDGGMGDLDDSVLGRGARR